MSSVFFEAFLEPRRVTTGVALAVLSDLLNGLFTAPVKFESRWRAWHGLTQNVSPEGETYWGQPISYEPCDITRDGTEKFVTGAFLLAGSEIFKLAPAK